MKNMIVAAILILAGGHVRATSETEVTTNETTKEVIIRTRLEGGIEALKAERVKRINEYVTVIKKEKVIPAKEYGFLETLLEGLYKVYTHDKKVLDACKNARDRRNIIVNAIGNEAYRTLEEYFQGLLKTGLLEQRSDAIDILGKGLFSVDSIELIKPYVLHHDPPIQFSAILYLTCLDAEGAATLLKNYILSGMLSEPVMWQALKGLNCARDKELEQMAVHVAIINKRSGPFIVREALEMLENSKLYMDAVEQLFMGNRFSISERENMILNEYLTDALYKHGAQIKDKKSVFAKARQMVESPEELYIYTALLLAEFGGIEEREFLEKIVKSSASDPEKIRYLQAVLKRKKETQTPVTFQGRPLEADVKRK